MIVIKDLSKEGLDVLMNELGSVCDNVAYMGAPETYRVTLSDEALILYKARGTFVMVEYMGRQCHINLSDFATMEIL